MDRKFDDERLDAAVVCLIGLPNLIGSQSRQDREFGKIHLEHFLKPAFHEAFYA